MFPRASALMVLLMACPLIGALGSDWPQWRGPDRNGVAPDSPPLAEAWPRQGPKLVWRVERLLAKGQESGFNSPAVAAGRVYVSGCWKDPKAAGGACEGVTCLDAATGKQVWVAVFPVKAYSGWNTQATTPCVAGNRVYFAGRRKSYCLDSQTGQVVWTTDLPNTGAGWVATSFAVVDGIASLIVSGCYGYDAATGALRWKVHEGISGTGKDDGWGESGSPVLWRKNGKTYLISQRWDVNCIDPADGRVLWRIPALGWGGSWCGNSCPGIVGDNMMIQRAGGLEGFQLTLEKPIKLWRIPYHEVAASPLLYGLNVYTLGGGDYGHPTSIRCANAETGEVAWERKLPPQGCASPIAADGKVFGKVQMGRRLGMWKATADGYRPLGSAVVRSDPYSSPALVDGRLYLRLRDGVACYDLTRDANPVRNPQDHYLTLAEAERSVCGWSEAQDGTSVSGQPLSIGTATFDQGIGTHAPGELVYALDGQYRWLTFYAGISADQGQNGSMTVQVWADGKNLGETQVMRGGDGWRYVSVSVAGVDEIKIVITDAGDGNNGDHVNICNLRVSTSQAEPAHDGPLR